MTRLTGVLSAALATVLGARAAAAATAPVLFASNLHDVIGKGADLIEQPDSWSTAGFAGSVQGPLGQCVYDAYIVVTQPGVTDDDLQQDYMPYLSSVWLKARYTHELPSLYTGDVTVSEMADRIRSFVADRCNAERMVVDTVSGSFTPYVDMTPRVIEMDFNALSADAAEREVELQSNDALLGSVLHKLPSGNYVIIYAGETGAVAEPSKATVSEHTTEDSVKAEQSQFTLDTSSLFAEYQFFSPGLFMTGLTSLLLLVVLALAMTWLSGLQVSYRAFEPQPATSEKRS